MSNIKKFIGAPDRQLFEKQPKEPEKAWTAFVIYREMGWRRTIHKAAAVYRTEAGLSSSDASINRACERWAARWGWTARAEEWDREIDKHRRKAAFKEVEKMHKRHSDLGKSLQALGAMELKKYLKELQKKEKSGNLTVNDVLRAIEAGVKLERSSRGEPDSIIEERHQFTEDEERAATRHLLGDEEALAALDQLMKKTHADAPE